MGVPMSKNGNIRVPTIATVTDMEIEAAAKRLGANGTHSAAPQRKAGVGQVLQSLAQGRSRVVAVEVKPSSRWLDRSR